MESLPGQQWLTKYLDDQPMMLPLYPESATQNLVQIITVVMTRMIFFIALTAFTVVASIGIKRLTTLDPISWSIIEMTIFGYGFATAVLIILRGHFLSRLLRQFDPILILMLYGLGIVFSIGLFGLFTSH